MTTLADFLLARIAEDQDWAQNTHVLRYGTRRYDKRRILAECEAKRMIVGYRQVYDWPTHQPHDSDPFCIAELDAVLRELAQPYADHPDFRDEWRVSPVAGSHKP